MLLLQYWSEIVKTIWHDYSTVERKQSDMLRLYGAVERSRLYAMITCTVERSRLYAMTASLERDQVFTL